MERDAIHLCRLEHLLCPKWYRGTFNMLDGDSDGRVTLGELQAWYDGKPFLNKNGTILNQVMSFELWIIKTTSVIKEHLLKKH